MFTLNSKNIRRIAIDLGNNHTILAIGNQLVSEPSMIVLSPSGKVKAFGRSASQMSGKTHNGHRLVKPLKGGVIANAEAAGKMLKEMINAFIPGRTPFFRFQQIIGGIPYDSTEVERRALRVALGQFSSASTLLIFEPLAAAIGLGLDIREPKGKLIVDIGGGITEISLISLSGIVSHVAIKTGGDELDGEIQNYMERHYYLSIGSVMAESVKVNVGAALLPMSDAHDSFEVIGKDLITGIPKNVSVDSSEIAAVLDHSIAKIESAILQVLEECPPELAGDIYDEGIYLTGGGALLGGLAERLKLKCQLEIHIPDDPLSTTAKGIAVVLKDIQKYKAILIE